MSQYILLFFGSPVYLHIFWNSVKIVVPVVLRQIVVSVLDSDEDMCAVRGLPDDEGVITGAAGEIADRSDVFYEDAK